MTVKNEKYNAFNRLRRKTFDALQSDQIKFIVYGGAAGGGKSWLGCEWLLRCCYNLPGSRWFIGRNNIKDSRESVYITWKKVSKAFGWDHYWKYTGDGFKFHNGSEVLFLDLTLYPQKDPFFERLGSKEFTGGWIEEAGEVNEGAFDVLKSRVGRHNNSLYKTIPKILITCNPKKNWLYVDFYRPWKNKELDTDKAFIQALPTDNPFLPKSYIESLQAIKDKAKRERLLFGNWEYDDDPTALVEYEAALEFFTNDHIEPDLTKRYITADVAAYGSDKFIVTVWYGWVAVEAVEFEKSGGKLIVDTINDLRIKHSIPQSQVVYDHDGIGGFIGGETGFLPNAHPFLNGSRPLPYGGEDERYENLKAQCAYHMAEKINKREVWGKSPLLQQRKALIIEELEQWKRRDPDNDTVMRLVRKDEIKLNIKRSPDYSDTILMRFFFELEYQKALPAML